jgi:hypothetical protein
MLFLIKTLINCKLLLMPIQGLKNIFRPIEYKNIQIYKNKE